MDYNVLIVIYLCCLQEPSFTVQMRLDALISGTLRPRIAARLVRVLRTITKKYVFLNTHTSIIAILFI